MPNELFVTSSWEHIEKQKTHTHTHTHTTQIHLYILALESNTECFAPFNLQGVAEYLKKVFQLVALVSRAFSSF